MGWENAFIVYRVGSDGSVSEVFHHDSLQKAKYWLTYIAECGDVLFRTPAHPKAPASPEYISHKHTSGKLSSSYDEWKTIANENGFDGRLPSAQCERSEKD